MGCFKVLSHSAHNNVLPEHAFVFVVVPKRDIVYDAAPNHTVKLVVVCSAPPGQVVTCGVAPAHDLLAAASPNMLLSVVLIVA